VDGLEPGGEYSLTIEAPGYAAMTQDIKLDQSVSLGTVVLAKS
jgi:hypothetical protein